MCVCLSSFLVVLFIFFCVCLVFITFVNESLMFFIRFLCERRDTRMTKFISSKKRFISNEPSYFFGGELSGFILKGQVR